jgi:hypothetical protein
LIISASTGWLLLEEVSYLALLGYCCMISVIVFTGLYSNLLRLLSLGYFFGYWLLSSNMLLYPFSAPELVQKNVTIMISGSLSGWLPVIGLVLIVYFLARVSRANVKDKTASEDSPVSKSVLRQCFKDFPKTYRRELFGSYLSLFCLLMAVPLGMLVFNSIVGYINHHILFAGFAIWILDRLWQTDVVNEPALSSDFRYFANLVWRR